MQPKWPAATRLCACTLTGIDSSASWLQIYICGGCSEASWQWGALSFTLSSREWGALPDMPGIHAFGASASVGQTVYVMGGSTTGSQEDWSTCVIRWVPCVDLVLQCCPPCEAESCFLQRTGSTAAGWPARQLPAATSAAPEPALIECALLCMTWHGNLICCSRALQILHCMLCACSRPSGVLCTPRLTCFICLHSCDTAAPSPSWVTRAPMQAARGSLAAAAVHNTIYTMGGGAGQQHLSVCEG